MTIGLIIKSLIEVTAVVLLIYGYIHEQDVIEFEQKLWKAFCRKVNRAIRAYEGRQNNGE